MTLPAAHSDAFVATVPGHRVAAGPGDGDDDDPVPIGDPPDDDVGDDQDDDDEEDDDEPMQARRCASPHRQRARIAAQCRPGERPRGALPVARYPIPEL
jgi:hypothetical protein